MPTTGYKWVSVNGVRAIATLMIPDNARSTLGRNRLKNPSMAAYRCDRAYVVSILLGTEPAIKATSLFSPTRFVYEIGQEVRCPNFDPEEAHSGIHFYLTKERLPWDFNSYNGHNKIFAENGWLAMEFHMKNGQIQHETLKVHTYYESEETHDDFVVNPFKKAIA